MTEVSKHKPASLHAVDSAASNIHIRQMKKLPTPSHTVSELLTALVDENMDYKELARILEQFPSIVVRIVALANSAWSSPVSRIDSLEMACARLGFNVVRSISIAIAISSPFDPSRCPSFKVDTYWFSAFMCADAAGWLAAQSKAVNPQVARTAGLLYNLGLLWLVVDQPDNANSALLEAEDNTQTTNALLHQYCGMGYDHAGAMIAQAWKLPDNLSQAIGLHRVDFSEIDDALVYHVALACHMISAIRKQSDYIAIDVQQPFDVPDRSQQQTTFEKLVNGQERLQQLASSLCGT